MRKICAVSFLTRGEQNLPCQRGPSLYFLLKLIDLPDLADYRHTVPLLKGIVRGKFHIGLVAVLHGDDIDAVDFAHIQLADAFAQHLAAHGNAPHFDAVAQGNVIQQPPGA